jgi:NADPH-dependent 2,4-dienoyl-CoA reductase/sulfur reductase-like enzyme
MSSAHEVDVAIVGAGPAGLAAALAARSPGVSVLVLDEYAQPGGQYHRQSALAGNGQSSQGREGQMMAEDARRAGVQFWPGTTVWAAYRDGALPVSLSVDKDGVPADIRAQRLVIATGAHDRVMPFPGWTLPGVITAGAAQALVKAHAVLPGQRVVVAGSGPFLLVVAAGLVRAGAKVDLIEAATPGWSTLAAFLRFPERWPELASLLATLLSHGVSIRRGCAITRAEGSDAVVAAISQCLDASGAPIAGTERRHPAECLAVANGFRAQAELAQLLGCATRYDEAAGGRVVVVDQRTGRTSVENVYAAGEVTGVAGREVAAAEGAIAGVSAAASLGQPAQAESTGLERARARRRRAQSFADLVARTFAPAPGLTALALPETVVCRCEGVRRADIDAAIDAGAHTTSAVKRWTRCGMGRCQGRICGWPLARIVARRLDLPMAAVDNFTARLPLKPVALAIVNGHEEVTP